MAFKSPLVLNVLAAILLKDSRVADALVDDDFNKDLTLNALVGDDFKRPRVLDDLDAENLNRDDI